MEEYMPLVQTVPEQVPGTTTARLYKTLVRSALNYGSGAWAFTKCEESRLQVFGRGFLRIIYGSLGKGGRWKRRRNHELCVLYLHNDRVTFIKT